MCVCVCKKRQAGGFQRVHKLPVSFSFQQSRSPWEAEWSSPPHGRKLLLRKKKVVLLREAEEKQERPAHH